MLTCVKILIKNIYCGTRNRIVICAFRFYFLDFIEGNKSRKINIFILRFKTYYSKSVLVCCYQIAILVQSYLEIL